MNHRIKNDLTNSKKTAFVIFPISGIFRFGRHVSLWGKTSFYALLQIKPAFINNATIDM